MAGTSARAQSAIDILTRLVAFDTTSHLPNIELIGWVEKYLSEHGIQSTRITNADGSKSNLLATIGTGERGIVLSGHTDVVPVTGQQWTNNPFELTPMDGKLYGRGTSDMKSFLACCLALVPEWKNASLPQPLHLAFSYDEEIGCLGAPALAGYIRKQLPKPALVIIGEPTLMQVVVAHKGVLSFETTVTGLEAHSSQTDKGVNAVQYAAELVVFLKSLSDDIRVNGTQDERFDPPYTTVHVGMFHGGQARNIIPKQCTVCWEIRPLPSEDSTALLRRFEEKAREIEAQMRTHYPKASIITLPQSTMDGMESGAEDALCQRVMAAAQSNATQAVAYGTEAGIFQANEIPAIVCGPGSIQQAHKPDEFIETSQIDKCLAFLRRLTLPNEKH